MSREKKKGTSGNAKAFITRAKALKKLQLSLEEFRRLCILKGIYPRDPKKKLEGTDKTYYLRKDIDFLAHERLINTIREQNSHHKKFVKAQAKRRIDVLKRLALNAPKARLDHLIVERYPNFTDAIRELDDPLCVVALFANLPADHKVGIAPSRVSNCQRLLREFHNFVAETNALRRVFVSIKGYYFQAKISGEVVTWVTPHRFSQILPADVDYSVMLTFLELYECIMSFVNFRLYVGANMAYPPKISRREDAKGLELSSVETKKLPEEQRLKLLNDDQPQIPTAKVSAEAVKEAENLALANVEEEDSENENGVVEADEADENKEKQETNDIEDEAEGIFAGKSFVLGREVPYQELEFTIMASGATKVIREDDLPSGDDRLSGYTHWIVDRPKLSGDRDMSLEYVQPQYVFDSINATTLLPTSLYAPGANLPPHLSPFVTDEDDGGYRPWFKDVIDRIKAGDTSVVGEAARVVYAEALRKEKQKNLKPSATNEASTGKGKKKTKKAENKELTAEDTKDDESMGEASESNEESDVESDSDSDDGSDVAEKEEEDDDEGEEEREDQEKEATLTKQSKEMAALMLTRKKMRQYRKHRGRQRAEEATKKKLTDKRKALDDEREEAAGKKISKRRKKVQ